MGFCLFESALERGLYLAVNPAYVDGVHDEPAIAGPYPASRLEFSFATANAGTIVHGTAADVQKILMKGTKIGIQTCEVRVYGGRGKLTNSALVINNAGRVALVAEIFPDQLGVVQLDAPTASYLFMEDGSKRLIVDRPGVFAFKANRKGEIPALTYR